jgi:assimilatory nitrate reductase catalytic subunit
VGSTGTPRLFADRFATDDGRAQLVAVRVRAASETPTADQLTLITGRLLEHYQSGTQTRRVPELQDARPTLVAQIHPVTARDRGMTDGSRVRVSNHRGSLTATVSTSLDVRPDTVFLPFHYADNESANLLTNDAVDPVSKMPEFKTTVVRVERETSSSVPN